eukprot:871359_1
MGSRMAREEERIATMQDAKAIKRMRQIRSAKAIKSQIVTSPIKIIQFDDQITHKIHKNSNNKMSRSQSSPRYNLSSLKRFRTRPNTAPSKSKKKKKKKEANEAKN